jgi:pimeloyl-ACP methyl ester carboxylesterase
MRLMLLTVLALLAAGLSGLGLATKILSLRAERAFPPLGRILEIDGFKLHAIEEGSGQPVVYIHGAWGALHDFTASLFDSLRHKYRAVAIDRPGNGYSDPVPDGSRLAVQARYLRDAVQAMGASKPILVGFSLGGAVALAYALEYPDEVGALVLVNPASHDWPGPVDALYYLPTWPLIGPILVHTVLTPLAHLRLKASVSDAFSPGPVPQRFEAAPLVLGMRPQAFLVTAEERRGLKNELKAQSRRYSEIRIPSIIIASDEDRVVRARTHARPLHQAVSGSELVIVPGAGHPIHYSHPDIVLAAIDRAARRIR